MRPIQHLRFLFSSTKYFIDQSFQNASLIAKEKPIRASFAEQVFTKYGFNLGYVHAEGSGLKNPDPQSFKVELSYKNLGQNDLEGLINELKGSGIQFHKAQAIKVPWFPKNIMDLNLIGKNLMVVNESKEDDQFQDKNYRKRRDQIAYISMNYKVGDKIPNVKYTQEEEKQWQIMMEKIKIIQENSMCDVYLRQRQILDAEIGISRRIPQLTELNDYLKNRSGYTIKPTHGILSQREFLNALAFKMFCCTQYLRRNPDHSPEPDVFHEVIGHVPMFADTSIANISQKIGLLSLGASDKDIQRLGSIYWFTMEYGVFMKPNGQKRAYGAAIASSHGEIKHLLSQKAKFSKLDPFKDCTAEYMIQEVQDCYRYTESFDETFRDINAFGNTINKPIVPRYNEQTNQIQYDRNIEAIATEDGGPYF